jgi:hypothetical protein
MFGCTAQAATTRAASANARLAIIGSSSARAQRQSTFEPLVFGFSQTRVRWIDEKRQVRRRRHRFVAEFKALAHHLSVERADAGQVRVGAVDYTVQWIEIAAVPTPER